MGNLNIKTQPSILAIDDNDTNLFYFVELLKNKGYIVQTATSGMLGLKMINEKLPDLILLDINMPKMSGIEVCEKLKSNTITKEIPVLFVSALFESELKVQALNAGGVDYITKPFSSEEILARISTHLKISQIQKQLSKKTEELKAEISERKLANEKIRESESNIKSIIENREDSIWSVDKNINFVIFNSFFAKDYKLAYNIELKKGINAISIIPKELRNFWKSKYNSALSGEITIFEFSQYINDKMYYYRVSMNPIIIDESIAGVSGISVNITDIKQVEEKLRESDERYRLATTASDSGIWDWLIETNKVYYSDQWKAQLGYKPNELTNEFKTWENLLHPNCKHRLIKKLNDFLEIPTEYFIAEFRLKHKDGSYRWIYNKASASLDKRGNVTRMFGAHSDITEKKNAVIAMEASEQNFKDMSENAPYGVMITHKGGKIIYSNRQMSVISGYSVEELRNMTGWDLARLQDIDKLKPLVENRVKGKVNTTRYERNLVRKDGSEIVAEFSTTVTKWQGKEHPMAIINDISERKEAEEKVNYFSNIFSQSLNEIYIFDFENYKFILANDAALKNLGYSMKEFLEFTPWHIKPDYNKKSFIEVIKPLIKKDTGKIVFESLHKRKDGTTYNAEVHVQLMNYKEKRVFTAFVLDITKRKQAYLELEESELKFRLLSDYNLDLEYWLNSDGKYVYISPSSERIIGYKAEVIMANPNKLIEIVRPDYRDLVKKHYQDESNEEFPIYTFEFPIKHANGEERWIEHTCRPIFDKNCKYLGRRGNNHDITNLKKSELKRLNLLQQNLKRVKELNCLFNISNSIQKNNDIETLLYDVIEMIPLAIDSKYRVKVKITVDDKEFKVNGFEETVHGVTEDIIIDKKNRGKIDIFFIVINSEIGEDLLFQAEKDLFKSIAELLSEAIKSKDIENELSKNKDQLEQKVIERTAKLEEQNEKLRYSQQAMSFLIEDANVISEQHRKNVISLQNANEELESFSYSVSHDLRAPLTRMDGFSKALLDMYKHQLNDQGKHFIDRIRASSKTMAGLIDDMLALSRLSRHTIQLSLVNISELSHTIINNLIADDSNVKTDIKIQESIVLNGDEKLINILLENLISNAWKFAANKPTRKIEIGMVEIDDNQVVFVKDNGDGFDMKYHDTIFKPFQRLHSDTNFKGTGIGLAIVKRIVNRHNGKIWAKSEIEDLIENKASGTIIYFYVK